MKWLIERFLADEEQKQRLALSQFLKEMPKMVALMKQVGDLAAK